MLKEEVPIRKFSFITSVDLILLRFGVTIYLFDLLFKVISLLILDCDRFRVAYLCLFTRMLWVRVSLFVFKNRKI